MMNLWIELIGAIIITLVLSASNLYRGLCFVVVAAIWLGFAYVVPSYMGFPVSSNMVGTRQAVVLYHVATPDSIYLLVRFTGDTEPRFVIMPKTDANEKSLQDGGDMMIVQFNSMDSTVSHVDMNNSNEFSKPSP